ncbi:MAG: T9SS type A sorting domain-containing protein, partial [Chitinophagaceae bacterium]
FVDANPVAGIQYYRLKQTDINGEFTYSSISPVNFSTAISSQLNIFPIPANNFINVELSGASEMTVTIYNSNCQKVFESTSGSLLNIDIQEFNAGLYIVEVKADNNVVNSKFLKN